MQGMRNKNRCVVIGGAAIENYERMRAYLRPDDFFVFCDSGLSHLSGLGIEPDLIVGDFDSHENPDLPVETIVLPCQKDDTDTVFAVKEATRRGFTDFLLLGVIGQRFDHSIGNIGILYMLDSMGLKGMLVDNYSEMEIVSGGMEERANGTAQVSQDAQDTQDTQDTQNAKFSQSNQIATTGERTQEIRKFFVGNDYAYFSLLNLSGTAEGITVKNAEYPLENATITCEYQYGISNRVLPGKTAEISIEKGRLLLVRIFEQ